MEKQIYYIVKDNKDHFFIGRFNSPQEALDEVNENYRYALDRGVDKRNEEYGIYRVDFSREFNEAGVLLCENQSIRLWMMAQFSEINNKYIMNV